MTLPNQLDTNSPLRDDPSIPILHERLDRSGVEPVAPGDAIAAPARPLDADTHPPSPPPSPAAPEWPVHDSVTDADAPPLPLPIDAGLRAAMVARLMDRLMNELGPVVHREVDAALDRVALDARSEIEILLGEAIDQAVHETLARARTAPAG